MKNPFCEDASSGGITAPDMENERREKFPLDPDDTRLLFDAIKELNISKRNVGLYPRDHPLTKESIGKAFRLLQKLFESKGSITLGIAKDTLMIGETALDKKNPSLKEFALSLHRKGVAAITLCTTLAIEELFSFHELITEKDTPMGAALIELVEERGLRDVKLVPLDLSKFKFVEGLTRKEGGDNTLWDEYVSGLLDGRLADEDMDDLITNVSPEEIAVVINKNMPGDSAENACDAVISSYLERKGRDDRKPVLFGKFLSMVDNLTPDLKRQFLTRSCTSPSMDAGEVERLLGELTFDDIEKMMKVFGEQSSLLPEKLKNLVDRLKLSKTDIFAEIRGGGISCVDDIEVDKEIVKSFKEDRDGEFADKGYREELKKMMEGPRVRNDEMTRELEDACKGEIVDRTVARIMFTLLNVESNSREEYQRLLSNLTDFADGFIETGRFSEISEIYDTVRSHSLTGTFRGEASGTIKRFFGSQRFLLRLIDAFRIWGRHNKEGVIGLSISLKNYVVPPLLDALSEEKDSATRRFFLDLLCRLGGGVVPEAVKRLDDDRWYVTRNMIYLVRECNGSDFINRIRRFTKHDEDRVVLEAMETLLHFKTPDSISYIQHHLRGKDPLRREQAVHLAGTYKVKEAVPYLTALLGKKDLFGTKSDWKVFVVHSLGEIGDPGALKTLQKICESNTLLHRTNLERLKLEIFRSLHHYPSRDVKPLLELGLKSRIKGIRAISEKLLKGGGEKRD